MASCVNFSSKSFSNKSSFNSSFFFSASLSCARLDSADSSVVLRAVDGAEDRIMSSINLYTESSAPLTVAKRSPKILASGSLLAGNKSKTTCELWTNNNGNSCWMTLLQLLQLSEMHVKHTSIYFFNSSPSSGDYEWISESEINLMVCVYHSMRLWVVVAQLRRKSTHQLFSSVFFSRKLLMLKLLLLELLHLCSLQHLDVSYD